MVMSTSPTAPPPALAAASTDYARPLGHRLHGKFHRFPLVLAGIAIVSLLLPLAQADAAVIEPAARGESIAAQTGLEPAAQQREGRRGGGEFRGNRGGGGGGRDFSRGGGREFRGGGGGREFRAQPRSNIGSARIDTPREFRQERRADQQDFRQDRRGDRRDFRTDRRDDRRDFRQDRRGDIRDYRDNRRGYSNRGWDGRNWDGRGGRGGNWDRGWRNDRRYDWYGYRNQNRNFYRAGRYFAPVRGWNYRRLGIGFTLGAPFFASSFWINDPWAYRLPPAYGQLRWVRYYGDVLLVDIYTGEVVDVINDFFW